MGWDFTVTTYDHHGYEELATLTRRAGDGSEKLATLMDKACSALDRDPVATEELNADPTRSAWLRAAAGVLALRQPGVFLGRNRHLGELEVDARKLVNGSELASALAQIGATPDSDLSESNAMDAEQIRYSADPGGVKRLGLAFKNALPNLTELDPKDPNLDRCENGLERLGQVALWAMKRELGLVFSHDDFPDIRRWRGSKPGPAEPLRPPSQFVEHSLNASDESNVREESFADLSSRTGGYVFRVILASFVATTVIWLYRKLTAH